MVNSSTGAIICSPTQKTWRISQVRVPQSIDTDGQISLLQKLVCSSSMGHDVAVIENRYSSISSLSWVNSHLKQI